MVIYFVLQYHIMYELVKITKSTHPDKKLCAVFRNEVTNRERFVHFGLAGMSDYTIHKDADRKKNYLKRHKNAEDWKNPFSRGALSRWILWNKESLRESILDYKRRFFG